MSSRQERMKRRQEGNSGGSNYTRVLDIPESTNRLKLVPKTPIDVDILPFPANDICPDWNDIVSDHEEFGDPKTIPFFNVVYHNVPGVGAVWCHEKAPTTRYGRHECPICRKLQEKMDKEGLEWQDPKLAEFKPKRKTLYGAAWINPDNPDEDVFGVLDHQTGWLHKPLKEEVDEKGIFLLDETKEGHTATITANKHTFKNNKGEDVTIPGLCMVSFKKRECGFSEEDLAQLPPIMDYLNVQSPEEVYKLFHGISVEDNEPEKEEDAPPMTVTETDAATGESTTTETKAAPVAGSSSRRSSRRRASSETEFHDTEIAF
jgi:hypothetical protein